MDQVESLDLRSPRRDNRRPFGKLGNLVLRVARHRLVAYVLISFAVASGFHHVESRHRHEMQTQIYRNCVQQEKIKAQANGRIVILKQAQKALIFRTVKDKVELAKMVDRVQPLPAYDCTHLRP